MFEDQTVDLLPARTTLQAGGGGGRGGGRGGDALAISAAVIFVGGDVGDDNTLTATSARGEVFKVQVDGGTDNGNGNYTVTLLKPVLHESGNGENDATVVLTYGVKDSNNDTTPGTLTINFDDDTPVAKNDTATVVALMGVSALPRFVAAARAAGAPEDRPVAVQIYGTEPKEMSEAARWLERRLHAAA